MEMDDYQQWTKTTVVYPQGKDICVHYLMSALTSEVGEVAGLVKRTLRDKTPPDEFVASMRKELGDVLWYLARFADELGLSLADVAQANKDKLMKRQQINTLHGKGDDR